MASPLPLERNEPARVRSVTFTLNRSKGAHHHGNPSHQCHRVPQRLARSLLNESKTNPRRTFEEAALKELAESIRTQGVLSPLLVRPLTENGFEIVAGARRYRAAQLAEQDTVPVRIVNLTDAEALEAQLVENLIQRPKFTRWKRRRASARLLDLDEPEVQHRADRGEGGQDRPHLWLRD